jgi:hypothetical protein
LILGNENHAIHGTQYTFRGLDRLQRNAKAGTPNKCKFISHSMVAKIALPNETSYLRIRI